MVFDAVLDVGDLGMQQSSPKGIVGDVPGGLPPDRTSAVGGILSSEPQSPHVASSARVRVAQKVMQLFLVTKVNPSALVCILAQFPMGQ